MTISGVTIGRSRSVSVAARPRNVRRASARPKSVPITVRARAANLNPQLEEAARDLGASAFGAFRHVTIPLLAPAIAAGAMLAFALSFDDYVVTTFNAGVGSSTLPMFIYGRIRFGITPEINAISTIIVAVTAVAVLVAWRVSSSRDDQRPRPEEPEPLGS